jgi:AcrR family transcriptional regulator
VDARTSAPRTARDRARAEITAEIVKTAREHLAAQGVAGLSLRAVARELGMASSAVYRYFPSRDDLLTRLIIEAYDALADAVETAEATIDRDDLTERWMTAAHACRDWALAHPQDWYLIYGAPVPDYEAPATTIGPATRVSAVLTTILSDAVLRGEAVTPEPVPRKVRAALAPIREFVSRIVPDDLLIRGLMARTQLFGTISLEINGQFKAGIRDLDAYFDLVMRRSAVF